MDDDRIKILKREIETLRGELEHVFPEHERSYLALIRSIDEKERELHVLQPSGAGEEKSWWKKLLKR